MPTPQLPRPKTLRTAARILLAVSLPAILALGVPATAGAQGGSVGGTVTDGAGDGIGGVQVYVFREGGHGWSFYAQTETDGAGGYDFPDLPAGRYRLQLDDYYQQRFAFEYHDDVTRFEDATDVEVAGSPVVIDAVLAPAGRLSGTLTDPAGGTLRNTFVFVFADGDEEGNVLYLTNANDGDWEVGGLATGDYVVKFSGDQQGADGTLHYVEYYDDEIRFDEATRVSVTAGQTTAGVDAVMGLAPGGALQGRVSDPYGRAFDFATVSAFARVDEDWVLVNEVETSDYYYDGEYTLDLPAGVYRLRIEAGSWTTPESPVVEYYPDATSFDDAEDVAVGLDEIVEGVDAVLGDGSQGSISGTVTDLGGAPLGGIEVYVYDRSLAPLYDQTAVTAADGSYTLEGLWPETYFVEFYDPAAGFSGGFYPDLGGTADATTVPVGSGAVTGVDAALEAAVPGSLPGNVSGTVTDELGAPTFGVRVTAHPTGGEEWVRSAFTDAAGFYRLRDLPAGSYRIRFADPGGDLVAEWYDDATGEEDATPVAVADGAETPGVDAELGIAGAVSGAVTNPFGNAYPITSVSAYLFDGAEYEFFDSTLADEDDGGRYFLGGLPPGLYRICFYASSFGGPGDGECYDDVEELADATDLVVVAGEVIEGIDAIIGSGPPGAISGTVTDGAGDPVAGIEVILYDTSLQPTGDTAVTGADGSYAIDLLYRDFYYAELRDPAGILPGEFYLDAPALEQATPIRVDDGEVTGVDAVLDGAGSGAGGAAIAGTVTEVGTGDPLAGVRVRCFDPDYYVEVCDTVTGADGGYLLGGYLPAGDYLVEFRSPGGDYVRQYYDGAASSVDATPVTVALGDVATGVDAQLELAGKIAGTVTNPFGDAFSTLVVQAFRFDGTDWRVAGQFFGWNDAGYEIGGLPAGVYRVRFSNSPWPGGVEEWYDGAADLSSADDVTVVAGQTTAGIDAVLGDGSMLRNPHFDVDLSFWTLQSPDPTAITHSAEDHADDPASGSVRIVNATGVEAGYTLSQCLPVDAGAAYRLTSRVQVASGSPTAPVADAVVELTDGADCTGASLGVELLGSVAGDTAGGWAEGVAGTVTAPPSARSAVVAFRVEAGDAASFTVHWDALDFRAVTPLFADGFESGTVGGWSSAVGAEP